MEGILFNNKLIIVSPQEKNKTNEMSLLPRKAFQNWKRVIFIRRYIRYDSIKNKQKGEFLKQENMGATIEE